jgi:NAD-dependent SIR2 family protein deacetylase
LPPSDNETRLNLTHSLREGNFAVFCGAGISKNSGLPLVYEIEKRVLKHLLTNPEEIKEVLDFGMPFELFLDNISQSTEILPLLKIFAQGKPNTTHLFLAKLAKRGCLTTIATTNFDLLIERALAQQGLTEGQDFKKYCAEDDFLKIDFNDVNNEISLFKLHGSVDDPSSIRATIRLVASRTLSQNRARVIEHVFSTGDHAGVMVIGYSCSDVFDITPQIQSINEPKKEIVFVEHFQLNETDCFKKVDAISLKEDKNPFKGFLGKRISCNTDHLVEQLWKTLEPTLGRYEVNSRIEIKTGRPEVFGGRNALSSFRFQASCKLLSGGSSDFQRHGK